MMNTNLSTEMSAKIQLNTKPSSVSSPSGDSNISVSSRSRQHASHLHRTSKFKLI